MTLRLLLIDNINLIIKSQTGMNNIQMIAIRGVMKVVKDKTAKIADVRQIDAYHMENYKNLDLAIWEAAEVASSRKQVGME